MRNLLVIVFFVAFFGTVALVQTGVAQTVVVQNAGPQTGGDANTKLPAPKRRFSKPEDLQAQGPEYRIIDGGAYVCYPGLGYSVPMAGGDRAGCIPLISMGIGLTLSIEYGEGSLPDAPGSVVVIPSFVVSEPRVHFLSPQ
jgi:hypothetical protein